MIESSPEPDIEDDESVGPALFDAILRPHRSLSPRGFVVMMIAVSVIGFIAGMAFVLNGAWPVVGFFGLDIVLIYGAFRINYHSGRMYETVRLTERSLVVRRVSPNGKVQNWRFQPYWLQVNLEDPPRHDSALTISSHGKSLTIGDFLTPGERLEFAAALRAALYKLRQPPGQAAE